MIRLGVGKEMMGTQAKKLTFSRYKSQARGRGIPFLLSFEEFVGLVSAQCYYCGDLPTMITEPMSKKIEEEDFIHNGIDRVNNELGYVRGNCVSCCPICNRMKLDLFFTNFLDHVMKIYRRHKDTIKIIKEGFVV